MIEYIHSWWTKIMCRNHAEAGTDTITPRARHEGVSMETSPYTAGVDPSTPDGLVLYQRLTDTPWMNTARINELIAKGVVYAPDPEGDLFRVTTYLADRADREQQGTADESRCPCSGRHWPSAAACRWCRCHDPLGVHHLSQEDLDRVERAMRREPPRYLAQDLMQPENFEFMAVRPSKEIVCCPVCGHPQHEAGSGRCSFSVPSGEPSGGIESCRCVSGVIQEYET